MIYCVEDEKSIRELIVYTLTLAGYEAQGFECFSALEEALHKKLPELIMLDIMLPEKDGLQILKELKLNEATRSIPVIMTTAKTTELDKVTGLDLGADDYLAKPFGMLEMVSRVRAVLRRSQVDKDTVMHLSFKNIDADLARHTVTIDGKAAELTLKEYDLLVYLMRHPGIVFSREQLLEEIWGLNYLGESRTIDVHIGTLRSKLGHAGSYIVTLRKVGYVLKENTNDPADF